MEKSPEKQKQEIIEGINSGDARAMEKLIMRPDGAIDFYLDHGPAHHTDIIRTHPLTPRAASPEEAIKNLEEIGVKPEKASEVYSHLVEEREREERSRESEAAKERQRKEASQPTLEEEKKNQIETLRGVAQDRVNGIDSETLGINLNKDGSITTSLIGEEKVALTPPAGSRQQVLQNLEALGFSPEEAKQAYEMLKKQAIQQGVNLEFEQEKGSAAPSREPQSPYAALLEDNGMSRQASYACQNCAEVKLAHVGGEGRPASEERTH